MSNLVVPAPARVDLASGGPDPLDETPLDRHMDVLVGRYEPECARSDLLPDLPEGLDDPGRVVGRDEPLPAEHPAVSDAALDVAVEEPRVEGKRCREELHEPVRFAAEPSAPEFSPSFSAHGSPIQTG